MLRERFGGSRGRTFDIFNPAEMTEPSIVRARGLTGAVDGAAHVDWRRLPLPSSSLDAVFLLLSAHELRTPTARAALFEELARALVPSGTVVIAEHLRDAANFLAFGPGFLHFHSRRTWMRSFTSAGFTVCGELRITPFVRVFRLGRPV
jgi:SAM-dependent methyltransferase